MRLQILIQALSEFERYQSSLMRIKEVSALLVESAASVTTFPKGIKGGNEATGSVLFNGARSRRWCDKCSGAVLLSRSHIGCIL